MAKTPLAVKSQASSGRPETAFQQFGYDNNSFTNAEAEAVRIVKFEKTNWETAFSYVTEKVAFNMRQVIRQCRKNYWGVFDTAADPTTGREKIWEHLTKTFVDYVVTAYDLDTKDINFRAKNPESIRLTAVVRSIVKNGLDKIGFGEILDLALRQLAIDGTIVWKTDLEKGQVRLKLVDLLNFYIDPTVDSIADADSVIERIVLPINEFKVLAKKNDWLNKDLKGKKQVSRYDTTQNPGYNTNSDITFVELYKRRGLAKKLILTGDTNDQDLVPMEIICSGTNGNWFYHYAESRKDNRDKGYEEAWLTRVHGRWYGEGVAERLLQKQVHFNILSNIHVNREYLAQLGIFLIRKGAGITPQMISRLAANGAMSVTNIDTDVKQFPMETDSQGYYNSANEIYTWAQRYTGATDLVAGETLPASTPATNAAIQNQSAKSRFELIKEGIGMFLQRWLKHQGMPAIFSTIKTGDLVRMHLEPDQLQELDEHLINSQLAAQLDSINKAGQFVNPDQVALEHKRALDKLRTHGKDRFVKLLQEIDVTEFDVEPYITNEEIDKAVVLQNLNQAMQNLAPLVQLNPEIVQSMIVILRQELDLMGLDSSQLKIPTNFGQQQAQPPQGGQNPQSSANGTQNVTQPGGNSPILPPNAMLGGVMAPAMTREPA